MTDRVYIVSRTLETKIAMAENNGHNALIVTLDVLKEILALLKEQEAQKFFVDESGKITPLPVVVRCKDCKYDPRNAYPPEELPYWYPCKNGMRDQDWFCGYGKHKVAEGR